MKKPIMDDGKSCDTRTSILPTPGQPDTGLLLCEERTTGEKTPTADGSDSDDRLSLTPRHASVGDRLWSTWSSHGLFKLALTQA